MDTTGDIIAKVFETHYVQVTGCACCIGQQADCGCGWVNDSQRDDDFTAHIEAAVREALAGAVATA